MMLSRINLIIAIGVVNEGLKLSLHFHTMQYNTIQ